MRAERLRGQAWIVFANTGIATNALRQMQGFPFFEKPLRIQFAKAKSDAIAKKDGTFSIKEKRKRADKKTEAPAKRQNADAPPPPPAMGANGAAQGNPNKLLFAEGLPAGLDGTMLSALFEQYHGFKEVRLVEGKGVAFVEFGDDVQSGIALQGLNGFKLTQTDVMKLSYAKR
jgi:U2 small nuclear ribonucleoprotein B''